MVDVSIQELKKSNISEITKLTYSERQASAFRSTDLKLEDIEKSIRAKMDNPNPPVVFLARTGKKLVGWLMVSLHAKTAEIASYHPVIYPKRDSNIIAKELLETAVNYSKERGLARIEAYFNLEKHLEQVFIDYRHWFRMRGFNQADESFILTRFLTDKQEIAKTALPEGFKIELLYRIPEEKLYHCYYETFMNSQDVEFLARTEEERRKHFSDNIHPHYASFNGEASLVLLMGDQIAGFAMVHIISPEEGYLSDFGIHPDYRGQGLAKKLLSISMRIQAQQGLQTIVLHVSSHNEPAQKFYRDMEFKTISLAIRLVMDF
ncbi:MAG: GNAT family N-acetyltransferase [Candidatus Odinarchaeota archaeon]